MASKYWCSAWPATWLLCLLMSHWTCPSLLGSRAPRGACPWHKSSTNLILGQALPSCLSLLIGSDNNSRCANYYSAEVTLFLMGGTICNRWLFALGFSCETTIWWPPSEASIDRCTRWMCSSAGWCLRGGRCRRQGLSRSLMRTGSGIRELSFGWWGLFTSSASYYCFSAASTVPWTACRNFGWIPWPPSSRTAAAAYPWRTSYFALGGRLLRFRRLICSFNLIVFKD